MSAMVPVPFQPTRQRLLLAGEGWWVSDPGERYRIARINSSGDTLLTIERDWERVPVTAEDVSTALSRMAPEGEMAGEAIPEWHPPVQKMLALPDGHLLVRRRSAEGDVFDVFSPQGSYQSTIAIPKWAEAEFFTATNRALYGVIRGELDVPFVVRMGIVRE